MCPDWPSLTMSNCLISGIVVHDTGSIPIYINAKRYKYHQFYLYLGRDVLPCQPCMASRSSSITISQESIGLVKMRCGVGAVHSMGSKY